MALVWAFCALPCAAERPASSTAAAQQALSNAVGQALQGSIRPALDVLRSIPRVEFSKSDGLIRDCMLGRFRGHADGSLPLDLPAVAARALGIYRAYWRAALLRPQDRASEEERLRRNLVRLLRLPQESTMSEVEESLAAVLEAHGLHALMGRTAPLRELMLWREQVSEVRAVPLPEGTRRQRVELLDEFESLGWSSYATCDRTSTGGWVRPDAIYAVKPGWPDLNSEAFLVSFLGHETQHFADQERYGQLESWELEYRAKLAELAMARERIGKLLSAFSANQSDDRSIPHSFANRRVLAALRARLGLQRGSPLEALPPSAVRQAAEAELREDSRRRQGRKAADPPTGSKPPAPPR
jgi:hypothetical protein